MRFTTSFLALLGCVTVAFSSAIPNTQGDAFVVGDKLTTASTVNVAAGITTPSAPLTNLDPECTEGEQECVQAFLPRWHFFQRCVQGTWKVVHACTMDDSCCHERSTASDDDKLAWLVDLLNES
jgi:hypothetical protein